MTTASAMSADGEPYQSSRLAVRRGTGLQTCWLCGVRQSRASMVPDGGPAFEDVHWFCADVSSCTRRWTTQRRSVTAVPPAADAGPRTEAS